MPTITRVTVGSQGSIDDLNQLIELLEGTSGYELAFLLRCLAGSDFKVRLADASGTREFIIQDSAGVSVATIDSDGNMSVNGSFAPGVIVLPSSTGPSQTTEGAAAWDSDDDRLTVGTGAATKVIGLSRGAGSDASATQELMYDTTNRILKVWNGSASISVADTAVVKNYKTDTQDFTDTTQTSVVGVSPATFAFTAGASEVWVAEYFLPITFSGTGGVKFQFTGPSSPTNLDVTVEGTKLVNVSTTDNLSVAIMRPITMGLGTFSSDTALGDAVGTAATADAGKFLTSASNLIRITLRLRNGANAGDVTLQMAQNSDNGTTTLGVGCWMEARRVA